MNPRAITGRADLLRALYLGLQGPFTLDDAEGEWCGFVPPATSEADDELPDFGGVGELPVPKEQPKATIPLRAPLSMPVHWTVTEYSRQTPSPPGIDEQGVQALQSTDLVGGSGEPPAFTDLVPWARLLPALKHHLAQQQLRGIDTRRWVHQLAQLRYTAQPPQQAFSHWPSRLVLAMDFSARLYPYRVDMYQLAARLQGQCGRTQVDARWCEHGPEGWWEPWSDSSQHWAKPSAWQMPGSGSTLLVASDLGLFDAHPGLHQQWLNWLQAARHNGLRVLGLLPLAEHQISHDVAAHFDTLLCWSSILSNRKVRGVQRPRSAREPSAKTDQMLALMARCQRIDPPLLRAMRRALVGADDAHLEGAAWSHPDVIFGTICRVNNEARERYLQVDVPEHHLSALREVTHAHHAHLRLGIRWLEDLQWAESLSDKETIAKQVETLKRVVSALNVESTGQLNEEMRRLGWYWLDALSMNQKARLSTSIDALETALFCVNGQAPKQQRREVKVERRGQLVVLCPADQAPQGQVLLPAFTALFTKPRIEKYSGDQVEWRTLEAGETILCTLSTSNMPIELHIGNHQLTLSPHQRPAWAEGWGIDPHGIYCDLSLNAATQRLRYIPPGTFLMGSPVGLGGDYEHPQHPVTLTEGYWLADTPCTQAFWLAVMGANPSHFQDGAEAANRPVENVNVQDCEQFLKTLEALLPAGSQVTLPTEAQWEYACRVGTTGSYWWGDAFDSTKANTGGNIGGTTPVKAYAPNPWGLYDMHGNVWEWCEDQRLRSFRPQAEVDPQGLEGPVRRVVRGGSWNFVPVFARSAFRGERHPDDRNHFQGLRFVLRSRPQGPEGRS